MPRRLSQLTLKAVLSIVSAPRPQALILLKVAAATRTYGLDFYREAFVLFTMWWKGNSDWINKKCTFKVTFFIFLKNALCFKRCSVLE